MFEKLLCRLGKHKWGPVGNGWVSLSEDVQTEHDGRICKHCRILEGTTDKFEASEDTKEIVWLKNKLYEADERIRALTHMLDLEREYNTVHVKDGELVIHIYGKVGGGKSAVAALIEGRLKDLGLTVEWKDSDLDRQILGDRGDIAVSVAAANPTVTIIEKVVNKPVRLM